MFPVLKFVKNASIRKQMYIFGNSLSPGSFNSFIKVQENVETLEELLKTRRELAKILGFQSFAHMNLAHLRVAKDPQQLIQFLTHFANKIKPIALHQLSILSNEKKYQESSSKIEGMIAFALN